jgi:hypothetical protein
MGNLIDLSLLTLFPFLFQETKTDLKLLMPQEKDGQEKKSHNQNHNRDNTRPNQNHIHLDINHKHPDEENTPVGSILIKNNFQYTPKLFKN